MKIEELTGLFDGFKDKIKNHFDEIIPRLKTRLEKAKDQLEKTKKEIMGKLPGFKEQLKQVKDAVKSFFSGFFY